jgi:hypothetical protein
MLGVLQTWPGYRGLRKNQLPLPGWNPGINNMLNNILYFIIIIIIIINCNWVSTRWQCSVYKYKKHKHYIRRRRSKNNKTNLQYNNKEQKK